MQEIWKDIAGYDGIYQVSNMGRVKSVDRTYWHGNRMYHQHEKILRLNKDSGGYSTVMLYDKYHKAKRILVHILVARAFILNVNDLPEINHIDEDKSNNQVSNLEWCSRLYNVNYGTGRERHRVKVTGQTRSIEQRMRMSEGMKKCIAEKKRAGTYIRSNKNSHTQKEENQ